MNKKDTGSVVLALQIAVIWMILGGTFCYNLGNYDTWSDTLAGCGDWLPMLLPILLLCAWNAYRLRRKLRKESAKT